MRDPSRVRVAGPLGPFAEGFAAELRRQGYRRQSVAEHLLLVGGLSGWLVAEARNPAGLTDEQVARFVAARAAAGHANHLTPRSLAPLLSYLRRLGVVPSTTPPVAASAVEVLLARFAEYLAVERGLTAGTVWDYVHAVRPFLEGRPVVDDGQVDLAELSAGEVTAFVVARCPGQSRGAAKMTVTALRSLLAFGHLHGLIGRSLIGAVPSAAAWRLSGLPRALEPGQVQALLGSCDRTTATGLRDLAILTVLWRLGLRAGETAGLCLEDVDWRAGELTVTGKGRRSERLPLPADVGEAIVAYLQAGRPAGALDRSVFVRVRAPHRGLTTGGVTQVVVAASRRAGLEQIHAHRLRHTAATQMLRAGTPLVEVGQVLRHRAPLTTAIYAKVDRDALATLARPWPGARP